MIVESLIVNYGACPTATTIVEQMFCYVQDIVRIPNKSQQSVNYSIQQMTNIRGTYVREESYIVKNGEKKKRALRNKGSIQNFHKTVQEILLDVNTTIPPANYQRKSKRDDEFNESALNIVEELKTNKRSKTSVVSGKLIADAVVVFNKNFTEGKLVKDVIELDEFEKKAKTVSVTDIRDELINAYANGNKDFNTLIKNTKLNRKGDDPKDYACLKVIYADFLRQKSSNNSAPLTWTYIQKINPQSSNKYFAKEI